MTFTITLALCTIVTHPVAVSVKGRDALALVDGLGICLLGRGLLQNGVDQHRM